MSKRNLMIGFFTSTSILFSGCATIIDGGYTQEINIRSKKDVVVNIYKVENKKNLTTDETKKDDSPALIYSNVTVPVLLSVKRDDRDILIKPIDYHCKDYYLESHLNDRIMVNNLSGISNSLTPPIISTTSDTVTGAVWQYDNNVNLNCW